MKIQKLSRKTLSNLEYSENSACIILSGVFLTVYDKIYNEGDENMLKKVDDKEFAKEWAITRRKGKKRFIIMHGGLSIGLLSGVIYIFIVMIAKNFMAMPPEDSIFMNKLFQLTFLIVLGMIASVFIWWRNEKRYKKIRPHDKLKK